MSEDINIKFESGTKKFFTVEAGKQQERPRDFIRRRFGPAIAKAVEKLPDVWINYDRMAGYPNA